MSSITHPNAHAEWYAEVPRAVGKHVMAGMVLLALTFGGFGFWALTAPLAAAVISQGSFVATGRNKIVQHLEGGIIKEILISEGETVERGQPLLLLDETAALATERELFLRQVRLEAMETRIFAEIAGDARLDFPDHLIAMRSDFDVASMLDSQVITFDASRQQLSNDLNLLTQSIEALDVRARGYEFQLSSTRTQLEILREDLINKESLMARGLLRRSEVNSLRRAIAEAEGQVGRLTAEIDEIAELQARYSSQVEQTISERQSAALDELQLVQSELESVREQARRAENILQRVEVVAPVSGTVVTLHYHTSGGVIESGRPIAEILPTGDPLIIEASIPRTEIDVVRQGQDATIRLTSLNARTTPILSGEVFYVSADSIVDTSQEVPQEVYLARISVPPSQLERVRGFTPTPGMPAEIMIQTEERTFFEYLIRPIADSMNRAFREQ